MADSQDNLETQYEAVLEQARERAKIGHEAWSDIYTKAEADNEFLAGDQWPSDMAQRRKDENRPVITVNRLQPSVAQITNEQRQNRPSIKINPVDDKADEITAKFFQGNIRYIQRNSNADNARDTAFEGAAGPGIGFYRLYPAYEDAMSFNQDIKYGRIADFKNVIIDPFFKESDASDMGWGFIFDNIPIKEFTAEYGESKISQSSDWNIFGQEHPDWFTGESVRIAEYFTKEYEQIEICQLPDGQVLELEEARQTFGPEVENLPRRKTKKCVVKWYKITAVDVLEETTLPGIYIPIIPVFGREFRIKGKRDYQGIVRQARDAQMGLNFYRTAEAEAIALTPKAPFIAAEGQIPEEYKHQWETANTRTWPYLIYTPKSLNGHALPPPQRNSFEPAVMAITQASMQSAEDLKATTGIYDASLGARSNETSGKAILSRQQQAQTSNFHLMDNLTRAIRYEGKILVQWIPVYFDSQRSLRTIGEEGNEETIRIHDATFKYQGQEKLVDFSIGKYDVSVETGPSFATKRQEASQTMMELSKSDPGLMQTAPDLVYQNLDFPGAKEIAERRKKTLPPGLAEDKNQKPIPPEVQAQLQQAGEMIDQLTATVNEQSETLKTKKMELESRERIEAMKIQAQLALKQLELQGEAANATFAAELASVKHRLELLDFHQPINDEFQNDFNGSGSDQAVIQEQQPTGGATPGNPMEL